MITYTEKYKIWTDKQGKVTLAKCLTTGRFIKRAIAYKALNDTTLPQTIISFSMCVMSLVAACLYLGVN